MSALLKSGGGGKPQDVILTDTVNCNGICNDTSWALTQQSSTITCPTDSAGCAVFISSRYRTCLDTSYGKYIHEIEILKVVPQNVYSTCNCIPQALMQYAIMFTLDIAPSLFDTNFTSGFYEVTVRTSKCWYFDPLDSSALKSCDTNNCYQTLYQIYVYPTSAIYVIGHQTSGSLGDDSCNSQADCYTVLSSHDIPNGPLFSTPPPPPPPPPCPEECYWTIWGNQNTTHINTLGSLKPNEPLIIKAGGLECMRMIPYNLSSDFPVGIGINMMGTDWYYAPIGVLDILTGYDKGIISFSQGNSSTNPAIKLYKPVISNVNNDYYCESYPWWIENSGEVLQFKTGLPSEKSSESVSPVITFNKDGRICAKDMYVQISGTPCWGDFVFGDDYEFRNLNELENFIKQNKHLPDIPSADEVVNNGVQLGEMQGKLLRKIEELTLYVIQLKKENSSMQNEIKKLKQKINKTR